MSRARSVADLGNQTVLDLNAGDGTLKVGAGVTLENTGEAQFSGIVTASSIDTRNLIGNVSVGGVLTYEDVTSVDSVGIITARSNVIVGGGLSVTGISTFNGITTNTTTLFANNFSVSGVSTLGGNVVVGGATTELVVTGDARVTGILTVGTASLTLDGATGNVSGASLHDTQVSAISKEIADSAIDVFVYDTSKDSDGGAWRKRTKHTSWYNETTLGTEIRGTRREFPAVAVIVVEASKVTIYDGDDPELSLWISFPTTSATGVAALNGELCLSSSRESPSYHSLLRINFIADQAINHRESNGATVQGYFLYSLTSTGLAEIDDGPSSWTGYTYEVPNIRNGVCNDVAMDVLPNAPIDDATGLPRPTIAVATAGGISMIKDNGAITSPGDTSNTYKISFKNTTTLVTSVANNTIRVFDNVGALVSGSSQNRSYYTDSSSSSVPACGGATINEPLIGDGGNSIFGVTNKNGATSDSPLTFLSESGVDQSNNMVAYASTSYNTGWMHGDIKGAFLSDTDTTNAIELVTNGYFNSDVSNWTIGSVGTTATLSSHRLLLTAPTSGSSWGYVYQGITTEVGKTYKISLHYDRGTVDGRVNVRNDSSNTVAGSLFYADLGTSQDAKTYWNTFTATATTTYILLYAKNTSGGTSAYDQISVTLEKDRSINGKGLSVFGTVTKTAVATGANLVAYSNFSGTNVLRQTPNSDMNLGTSDAHSMAWYKTTASGSMQIISYEGGTIGTNDYGKPFNIRMVNGKLTGWASHDNFTSWNAVYDSIDSNDGQWHCAVWVRSGSNFLLYKDGEGPIAHWAGAGFVEYYNGGVGNNALSDANTELVIGARKRGKALGATDHEEPFDGSIALARIGKSAPSAEQIKKMYEDEKVLFQENAKATLYGSSDAVTGLAYDKDTELLHIGTASGRSEFQGLRRINNTTDPVTAAISASNDLVAEK